MHAEVTQNATIAQDAHCVVGVVGVGAVLRALRLRGGWSAPQLARAAGIKETTYKTWEDRYAKWDEQRPFYFPVTTIRQIMPHLIGRGTPPIRREELLALSGSVESLTDTQHSGSLAPNARLDGPAHPPVALGRDVPVLASKSAGWGTLSVNMQAAPIDWLPRPAALSANRTIYAVTMADGSMAPRFDLGERLYCDSSRPPPVGGYAVVVLRAGRDGEALAHIGRLTAISDTEVRLRTHAPDAERVIQAGEVDHIARVLTLAELLGG